VVVVTGCAVGAPPRPVEARLDRTTLALRLSDGTRCTAPVSVVPAPSSLHPAGTTVAGAGTFRDCTVPFAYTVTGDPGPNPLRLVLEGVAAAIGIPDAIAPRATVEITAPDGRVHTFASPADPA
jgi:hypothetical protein